MAILHVFFCDENNENAYFYTLYYCENANSAETRTAHIHALTATRHILLLYFREEKLKMVLQGDFIPPSVHIVTAC